MKAHMLTVEYNQYDQMGEYFVAWFERKPTKEELGKVLLEDDKHDKALIEHVLKGGGRKKPYKPTNEHWYFLREVKSSNRSTKHS
jgi:hypothetical protein